MSYRDRLSPWCIIQLLPKMQRSVVARFRKRNDAEAHLRALRQLNPDLHYEIVFDPPDPSDAASKDFSAIDELTFIRADLFSLHQIQQCFD